MPALRAAVLASFVSGVVVTAFMYAANRHDLHTAHALLLNATFLLLGVYLVVSAGLTKNRALTEALSKSGIRVRDMKTLYALAGSKTLDIAGEISTREGFAVTRDTLSAIGMSLGEAPVKIAFEGDSDVVLTQNKITHALKAYYIARLYTRVPGAAVFIATTGVVGLLSSLMLIIARNLGYHPPHFIAPFMTLPLCICGAATAYQAGKFETAVQKITFEKIKSIKYFGRSR
jgi:hypothetical protein